MSAGREGKSKGEFSREGKSFRLLVEGKEGEEEWVNDFQAVVDCTGTYGKGRWGLFSFLGLLFQTCRWLGEGGVPALGERKLIEKVEQQWSSL